VLFGRNVNPYTVYTQSDVYIHTNTYSSQYNDDGRAKGIKRTGTEVTAECQVNLSATILDTSAIGPSALAWNFLIEIV